MDLKELLGENYREDITVDEVKEIFKKQVLSSGEYENKGKSDAEKRKLESTITDLQTQLKSKMSEDEKKEAQDSETRKLIESLQKQLSESNIEISKGKALGSLSAIRSKAGIKDDDKDFSDFISSISFEDSKRTESISGYISRIVESAYETGKNDAVKEKLGKMGSFKGGQGDSTGEEKGAYGKQLAQAIKNDTTPKKDFFKKD